MIERIIKTAPTMSVAEGIRVAICACKNVAVPAQPESLPSDEVFFRDGSWKMYRTIYAIDPSTP
jgi:hypothetical protein